jgi:6-phosphogluconolactonase
MNIAGEARIFDDPAALAAGAAAFIADAVQGCRAPFRLCLSGGSTPRAAYKLLAAKNDLPWDRVSLFLGDERFVPPDHPDSNYRMVRETLLAGGHVQPRAFLPMQTDGTPDEAASLYEDALRQQYGASQLNLDAPLFDLMLLGLGPDGHTASLIPGQPVLQERTRWVAPVPQGRDEVRLTLTYPALESSRIILFLAAGADKAEPIARVRSGDATLPAGALKPQGKVIWLLDRAAAQDTK